MQDAQKRMVAIRYWLLGKGYNSALRAMEFASEYHVGTRKDGVTPEFDHQITIASYVRTLLPSLADPEETLCAVFLHDVREDYGIGHEEIERRFGQKIANAVDCLTKKFRGAHAEPQALFDRMANDRIASIVKPADRVHNLQTMVGVFGVDKQKAYIAEVRELFFPMIRKARRLFPEQEPAYENVKHVLRSQIELIEASHRAIAA